MNDDKAELTALKERLTTLQDEIIETKDKINLLLLKHFVESNQFKIGDRVMHEGIQFELVAVRIAWGRASWFGRKVLKAGGLHKCESQLYRNPTAVVQS